MIDSSVALSWFLPDEATDEALALYTLARSSSLVVPALWHMEMANVFGVNVKRRRLQTEQVATAIETLESLDIQTVLLRQPTDVGWYTLQMQTHGLTAYDATYIMLAQELRLPLATFDRDMVAAADRAGIAIVRSFAQPYETD